MSELAWLPVALGDVRVGDTVRTVDAKIHPDSRYRGKTGTVIGARSGSLTVQIGQDAVVFWPDQLERQDRPE